MHAYTIFYMFTCTYNGNVLYYWFSLNIVMEFSWISDYHHNRLGLVELKLIPVQHALEPFCLPFYAFLISRMKQSTREKLLKREGKIRKDWGKREEKKDRKRKVLECFSLNRSKSQFIHELVSCKSFCRHHIGKPCWFSWFQNKLNLWISDTDDMMKEYLAVQEEIDSVLEAPPPDGEVPEVFKNTSKG